MYFLKKKNKIKSYNVLTETEDGISSNARAADNFLKKTKSKLNQSNDKN